MEYNNYRKMLEVLRNKTDFVPDVAITLGSGLGALADEIDIKAMSFLIFLCPLLKVIREDLFLDI